VLWVTVVPITILMTTVALMEPVCRAAAKDVGE
jgi:hypothetical protein